jgi:serine/threonine-protein kinase HipA
MAATIRRVEVATVRIWDTNVGAVAWNRARGVAEFEYDPGFIGTGRELAPLTLPLRPGIFSFPQLNPRTFNGLPGLLADSLPDRFGNRIIDIWLARQGRSARDFTPIERLCYVGTQGMGALEFRPAIGPRALKAVPIEITELTHLATEILRHRTSWAANLKGNRAEAINTIIRVGTSAGGNRAKAVIAWNPKTGAVLSGQVPAPQGFEPWILKFDGVEDAQLGDPQGFGRVEYAYHRMAVTAGIEMAECRLMEESGRAHFMTRRFDRRGNEKVHMQSLCAIDHMDFNAAGEYGYEQAFLVVQRLKLGFPAMRELYRRMVFNVLSRNQDDHTRNLAFLMGRDGAWELGPAFDVVWAYNPTGSWTNRHQMSINGKRDDFSRADLLQVARAFGIRDAAAIIEQVAESVARWPSFSADAAVPRGLAERIGRTHRRLRR